MLTQEYLKLNLHYNPDTGIFTWIKGRSRIQVNSIAGYLHHSKYIYIIINQKQYSAHRLAWLYIYGYMPACNIDHIDGNPSNNCISNLREASQSQNMCNQKIRKDNKTGVKGIYFNKTRKVYIAKIGLNGKQISVGCFKKIEDAEKAIKEARLKYHKDFGREN